MDGFGDFEKGVLYVGHHGWPVKKNLDFRWSKKVEVTLKTLKFFVKYLYQYFYIRSYEFLKIY